MTQLPVSPSVLGYVTRYAVGVQSYAVHDVVEALIAHADKLTGHQRAELAATIRDQLGAGTRLQVLGASSAVSPARLDALWRQAIAALEGRTHTPPPPAAAAGLRDGTIASTGETS